MYNFSFFYYHAALKINILNGKFLSGARLTLILLIFFTYHHQILHIMCLKMPREFPLHFLGTKIFFYLYFHGLIRPNQRVIFLG